MEFRYLRRVGQEGKLFEVKSSEPREHVARLALHGELDLMTAPALRAAIDTATGTGYTRLEIDLSDLRFIDSTGIQLLVDAHRRMTAKSGETVVANPTAHVAKVLEVMGLNRLFNLA